MEHQEVFKPYTLASSKLLNIRRFQIEHQEVFGREILEIYSDRNSEDIDDLLAAASDQFESSKCPTPLGVRATPLSVPKRFAPPKTDEEILRARLDGTPESTQKYTKYCMNTWEEWRKHRQVSSTHIPPLTTMNVSEISHWLTCFILEARKKSGDPYTLHHILVGSCDISDVVVETLTY